jgi:hypothetical protein
MTDAVTCAGFSLGEPLVSVEALTNLRALLDSLLSSRSAGAATEGDEERSDEKAADLTSANNSDKRQKFFGKSIREPEKPAGA